MKLALFLLCCIASACLAQTFQVQPPPLPITVVCSSGQATASGNTYTCPGSVIPQCPSPPGAGPCPPTPVCSGYQSINLGDIPVGQGLTDSQGVRGNIVAYGRIVVPNPIPDNWIGKTTTLSVFEHGDGTAWKQIYMSKDKPCVFVNSGNNFGQGTTAYVNMTFVSSTVNAVTIKAGETWYATVRNQLPNGAPSCASGSNCNFGYLLPYPGQ